VVADLARHSSRVLSIRDAEAGELRVTGVVFRNNIDGWLAGLEATMPVRVVRHQDASVEITRGEFPRDEEAETRRSGAL
jgi:ferric-dicitrate binding protein FerR (iron transport regulator)